MDPYRKKSISRSPDSQPFFTELEEDNIIFNADAENVDGNKESQSLISTNPYGKGKQTHTDIPDSLFPVAKKCRISNIEKVKENSVTKRKYDSFLNNEQYKELNSKNYSSNHLNNNEYCNENDKFSAANENEDVENESSSASDLHNMKNADNVQGEECNECTFDKELDKRNYYFGNLLIGELQFLPPCMRSEAYVTILKYVDSLKQLHRKRHNN